MEIYQIGLRAVGTTPKPNFPRTSEPTTAEPVPVERRSVYFDEAHGRLDTPVFDRDTLEFGTRIPGPAVITQLDSTTVVPPGTTATIDEWANIRIDIQES